MVPGRVDHTHPRGVHDITQPLPPVHGPVSFSCKDGNTEFEKLFPLWATNDETYPMEAPGFDTIDGWGLDPYATARAITVSNWVLDEPRYFYIDPSIRRFVGVCQTSLGIFRVSVGYRFYDEWEDVYFNDVLGPAVINGVEKIFYASSLTESNELPPFATALGGPQTSALPSGGLQYWSYNGIGFRLGVTMIQAPMPSFSDALVIGGAAVWPRRPQRAPGGSP